MEKKIMTDSSIIYVLENGFIPLDEASPSIVYIFKLLPLHDETVVES